MSRRRVLALLIAYDALTALPTAAMPAFVALYAERFGYGLQKIGCVTSAETLGMALGQVLVYLLFTRPRWNLRRSMAVTLVVYALAQLLSLWPQDPWLFGAARFVSGFAGGGVMFATIALHIAQLPRADSAFALFYGALFLVGPLGIVALPLIFDVVGAPAVYAGIATVALLSLGALGAVPDGLDRSAPADTDPRLQQGRLLAVVLVLGSLFLAYVSNGGLWIYMDRIAATIAPESGLRGSLLAAGMACGFLGSIAAARWAGRVRRDIAIIAGQLVLLASYVGLTRVHASGSLLGVMILFNAGVAFFTPFYLAALGSLDASGRYTTLGLLALGLGYGTGPGLLAQFSEEGAFDAMVAVASVVSVASLVLLLAVNATPRSVAKALARPGSIPAAKAAP